MWHPIIYKTPQILKHIMSSNATKISTKDYAFTKIYYVADVYSQLTKIAKLSQVSSR